MLKEKLLGAYKKINFQNFIGHKFNKYFIFFACLVILVIAGLAMPDSFAHAAGLDTIIGGMVMSILYGILYIVFFVLFIIAYLVAWIGAYIVNISLNPAIMNNVFANPAIYQSWQLIRDICNLLFLLIMLFVAFGTIIQHSKYNIKNSLLKLIIAIFLINFSNVVAGVIIDFGNIIMFGVLKWMCPVAGNTCFQDSFSGLMAVIDGFYKQYEPGSVGLEAFSAEAAVGMAVATIYTFIYGFILLALAVFLIVRTAGLAVLLILSPFAYFGEVMPGMEKVSSKWWSKIWSYSLFGPIFVLMLYISSQIAARTIAVPPVTDPNLAVWGTLIAAVISNSIPLLFLLSIISITRELGLVGTNVILSNTTGLGEKIGVGAVKYVGSAADRYAARGARQGMPLYRRALSSLSPGAWRRAARNMKAEQEHDYDIAAASHWNKLEKLPGGNRQVNREQIAVDREVVRVMGTLADNVGQLADTNLKAIRSKNAILLEASARKISQTGDTNKVLKEMGFAETAEGFSDYMQEVKKLVGKDRAEVIAYEIGQNEDRDGNSGLIGFDHGFENDKRRLLDLKDTYYRSKKTGDEFEKVKGIKTTPEDTKKYIAEMKEKDAKAEGGITDRYKKWSDEYKTDKEYQQHSVAEKLAAKSPQQRNTKLKAITLFEQDVERDKQGNVILDENGKEKIVPGKFHIGDQGAEYYNTIGAVNLENVRFGMKKEVAKQRDALYKYALKHEPNKWNKNDKGLTKEEKDILKKFEDLAGPGDDRPTGKIKVKNPETGVESEEDILPPYDSTKKDNKKKNPNATTEKSGGFDVYDENDNVIGITDETTEEDEKNVKGKQKKGSKGDQGGYSDKKSAEIWGRMMSGSTGGTPPPSPPSGGGGNPGGGANPPPPPPPGGGGSSGGSAGAASNPIARKKAQVKKKAEDLIQKTKTAEAEEMITLEESERRIDEALKEINVKGYNKTLPGYYDDQSKSLGKMSDKLKEEKVDQDTIKYFEKAATESRQVMAENLRQKDMVDAYSVAGSRFGDEDRGQHKEVDYASTVAKLKQGSFRINDFGEKFDRVDKMIGGMRGAAGAMFGAEYSKAKALYDYAKKSGNLKEQQAYLAMTEHTLNTIENGVSDTGIKEVVETPQV